MSMSKVVAVITGGARGLGAATARRLVAHGARVVLADTNEQGLKTVAAELGASATVAPCDVTDPEQVRGAVAAGVEAFGGVTAAVQCAGVVSYLSGVFFVFPSPARVAHAHYLSGRN